jgi:hypothetical protein
VWLWSPEDVGAVVLSKQFDLWTRRTGRPSCKPYCCNVAAIFRKFPVQKVPEEFTGYVNISVARQCIPRSGLVRVKGSFMGCMGVFCWPCKGILIVHITSKIEPLFFWEKVASNMRGLSTTSARQCCTLYVYAALHDIQVSQWHSTLTSDYGLWTVADRRKRFGVSISCLPELFHRLSSISYILMVVGIETGGSDHSGLC